MTKRGGDDATGSALKKAHTDDDSELIVYSPSIVPPELKSRMNSLVEVLLPARHLVADHKQVRPRPWRGTRSGAPPPRVARARHAHAVRGSRTHSGA